MNIDTIMEYKWDFIAEDDRKIISEWSEKRHRKLNKRLHKSYREFLVYTFDLHILKSFVKNFNFMVLIQMALAAISVYVVRLLNIPYNVPVSLFVSPIVFPLAFSIHTDFQRREKVLDDLANFKSSSMTWFFCMRDWKEAAGLDDDWMKAVIMKVKSMLFHVREYLLTNRADRRKVILIAMYEDFSDTNQLIEKVRASKLPSNTSVIARVIHLLHMMCLSFERLRVIREYRSPRSIRSFNKVLIFILPLILAPYFVYLANECDSYWSAYFISVLVAFVFSALQGVQDKLDDPFDGLSEDDIDLANIDEWTFNSLEITVNRVFQIGRFRLFTNIEEKASTMLPRTYSTESKLSARSIYDRSDHKSISKQPSYNQRKISVLSSQSIFENQLFEPDLHPYHDVLKNIKGNSTILRGRQVKSFDQGTDSYIKSHLGESIRSAVSSDLPDMNNSIRHAASSDFPRTNNTEMKEQNAHATTAKSNSFPAATGNIGSKTRTQGHGLFCRQGEVTTDDDIFKLTTERTYSLAPLLEEDINDTDTPATFDSSTITSPNMNKQNHEHKSNGKHLTVGKRSLRDYGVNKLKHNEGISPIHILLRRTAVRE